MKRYFHGGPAGLSSDGFIRPPSETKVYSCGDATKGTVLVNPHRQDRVYLMTIRVGAELFAAMAPHDRVSVYLVEPIGDVEVDPDYNGNPGESVQVQKARILKETRLRDPRRRRILRAMKLI